MLILLFSRLVLLMLVGSVLLIIKVSVHIGACGEVHVELVSHIVYKIMLWRLGLGTSIIVSKDVILLK